MIKELLDISKSRDPRVQAERLMLLLAQEAFERLGLEIAFDSIGGMGFLETFYIFPVNAADISIEQFNSLAPAIENLTHGIFAVRLDVPIEKKFTVNYAPHPHALQLRKHAEIVTPKIAEHVSREKGYRFEFSSAVELARDSAQSSISVFPRHGLRNDPKDYRLKILQLRKALAPKIAEWTSGELSLCIFHRRAGMTGFFHLAPTPLYPWAKVSPWLEP